MGHIQNDLHNTEMSVIWPWIGEGSSRWAARRKNYSAAIVVVASPRRSRTHVHVRKCHPRRNVCEARVRVQRVVALACCRTQAAILSRFLCWRIKCLFVPFSDGMRCVWSLPLLIFCSALWKCSLTAWMRSNASSVLSRTSVLSRILLGPAAISGRSIL